MIIKINGKKSQINNPINVNDLLLKHGYKDKLVAVAINGDFVPRSSYDDFLINEQDDIEIVAPMQGG